MAMRTAIQKDFKLSSIAGGCQTWLSEWLGQFVTSKKSLDFIMSPP